jgi:hypothetical protein
MSLYQFGVGDPASQIDAFGLQTMQTLPALRHRPTLRSPRVIPRGPRVPGRQPVEVPVPRYPLESRPWEWGVPQQHWETPLRRPGFPGIEDSYPAPTPVPVFPAQDPARRTYPDVYPMPKYAPEFVGPPRTDTQECMSERWSWCSRFYHYHDDDQPLDKVLHPDEVLKRIAAPPFPGGQTPCEQLRDALEYHRNHVHLRRQFFDCMADCTNGNLTHNWERRHSNHIYQRLMFYDQLLREYYARGCNWRMKPLPPGPNPRWESVP